MRIQIAFAIAAVLVATACSSTTSGSGGSNSNTPAAKACADTADAVARAAQRCGSDYQQNYDAFVQQAAAGDCGKVVSVRDEAALRGTCIPSFAAITCADLKAGVVDASCKQQLQRPASFTPTLGPASAFSEELD